MGVRVDRWLARFCANRPTRVITINDLPYLQRIYLFHVGGWRFYLHRFVSPDGDRQLHDHPFHGFSVVLSGGYFEERMTALNLPAPEIKTRFVGWFNWLPARVFHRIAETLPGTWTLFVNAPHHKRWGFLYCEGTQVRYKNPYDEEGLGQGAHWWESAPTFKEVEQCSM